MRLISSRSQLSSLNESQEPSSQSSMTKIQGKGPKQPSNIQFDQKIQGYRIKIMQAPDNLSLVHSSRNLGQSGEGSQEDNPGSNEKLELLPLPKEEIQRMKRRQSFKQKKFSSAGSDGLGSPGRKRPSMNNKDIQSFFD